MFWSISYVLCQDIYSDAENGNDSCLDFVTRRTSPHGTFYFEVDKVSG